MLKVEPGKLAKLATRLSDDVLNYTDLQFVKQVKVVAVTKFEALVELTKIDQPIRSKLDGYVDSLAAFNTEIKSDVGGRVTIYLRNLQPWDNYEDKLEDPWDAEGLFGWIIARNYLEKKRLARANINK